MINWVIIIKYNNMIQIQITWFGSNPT